jgi:hypothetical protein
MGVNDEAYVRPHLEGPRPLEAIVEPTALRAPQAAIDVRGGDDRSQSPYFGSRGPGGSGTREQLGKGRAREQDGGDQPTVLHRSPKPALDDEGAAYCFFARLGWTRFGSPGIFG